MKKKSKRVGAEKSVFDFIFRPHPDKKRFFVAGNAQPHERDFPLAAVRQGKFIVNKPVVESGRGGVVSTAGVIDRLRPCPIDGA